MATEPVSALICGERRDNGVPGSVDGKCVDCGNDISIAPSGMKILAEHPGCKALCTHCGLTAVAAAGEPIQVNGDSRAELNAKRAAEGLPPMTEAEWKIKLSAMKALVDLYRGKK